MKILYLTPAWYGFNDILFEGEKEIKGLPSFTRPLKQLIEEGNTVDFLIMQTDKKKRKLNIQADWLNESQIKGFVYYDLRLPHKLYSIYKYRQQVKEIIVNGNYDFVYAHGSSTAVVRGLVRKYNIPFGQRLYGTFLWEKINKIGYVKTVFKHYIEYLGFKKKKEFLLVTNDGSRGDLVLERVHQNKRPPYEFYYWINGVNRISEIKSERIEEIKKTLLPEPFLYYCARFDNWKRQDKVLNIIYELKKRGRHVNVYFSGPQEGEYYDEIKKMVLEKNLQNQVVFMGNTDLETMTVMNQLALASLSLYDVCNLTNVFHEMLASGALIISKDDGVLNDFIEHGKNGFLVGEDDSEVVNLVEYLLDNSSIISSVRKNAKLTSELKARTWNERIRDEIDLIKKFSYKK